MDSRQAFDAIQAALKANPGFKIIDATYDEDAFGNFVISFVRDTAPQSFVLDRGELVLCDDMDGSNECRTVLQSICDVEEKVVLNAVMASI